jgi:hypothetical protein
MIWEQVQNTYETFQPKMPYLVAVQSTKAYTEYSISFSISCAHADRNNQVQTQLAVKTNT